MIHCRLTSAVHPLESFPTASTHATEAMGCAASGVCTHASSATHQTFTRSVCLRLTISKRALKTELITLSQNGDTRNFTFSQEADLTPHTLTSNRFYAPPTLFFQY
jgi:hypothetical protein